MGRPEHEGAFSPTSPMSLKEQNLPSPSVSPTSSPQPLFPALGTPTTYPPSSPFLGPIQTPWTFLI